MRIALHTSWGLVTMEPFSFAVMPGDDDVVIFGNPTLKLLGIDVYDSLGARARERAAVAGVDTTAYRQCRRVFVSVDALQQQQCGSPEEPDGAVERLVARGPDVDMGPEEELRARSEALEEAVLASVAAGLDESYVERLRDVIGRRWNAFRRGIRTSDPPARVEPLRVTLEPGARPVKARPRICNPVKTAWLAACMASLAAFGACVPSFAGGVGHCSYGYAEKRGVSLGERFPRCKPAHREGAGGDAEVNMATLSEAKF